MLAERKAEEAGQYSFFAEEPTTVQLHDAPARHAQRHQRQRGPRDPRNEFLKAEKEMLGFYVSEHPLAGIETAMRAQTEMQIPSLADGPDGSIRTVGGILSRMTRKFTKKGDPWYQGVLEDLEGSVEVTFWPQTVNETSPDLLMDDALVIIKGRVEIRDEAVKLMALKVSKPDLSGASRDPEDQDAGRRVHLTQAGGPENRLSPLTRARRQSTCTCREQGCRRHRDASWAAASRSSCATGSTQRSSRCWERGRY